MHISFPFLSGIIPLTKVKPDLLIVKYFPFVGVSGDTMLCNLDSLSLSVNRVYVKTTNNNNYRSNNCNTY